MDGDEETNRLGAYLRARRGLVTPERAGIPAGSNRRVAGLRREEVAMLAGISADYYLRLERGRDRNPSAQVITALARVLHLDEVEHQYLLDLAEPARRARPRPRPERVPARLQSLLAAVDVPAFVEGRAFDVLASTSLAQAFNPRLRGAGVPGRLGGGHGRVRRLVPAVGRRGHRRSAGRRTDRRAVAGQRPVPRPVGAPRRPAVGRGHDRRRPPRRR
jgi:transcriptional regulator with XRE-family HTH domain